jgi:hypothetical protein
MTEPYGPQAATRADAARATGRTAATLADPSASLAEREHAAEVKQAAYESYWHAHGKLAYGQPSAREGLIREHAQHGHGQIRALELERGDFEAGS